MNTIQFNKFSHLHNDKSVIFTHGNYTSQILKRIQSLNHKVILITGNCDHNVTEAVIPLLKNIHFWFAQNALIRHPQIIPTPLGLMSSVPSQQPRHGVVHSWAPQQNDFLHETLLKEKESPTTPNSLIYANFRTQTNIHHRSQIKNICMLAKHITWDEPSSNYQNFVKGILDHEAVVCPDGNGADSHRVYETLYLNRIPIVFHKTMYNNLWHHYPVILLDDIQQLHNIELIKTKIREINKLKQENHYNNDMLWFDYWENLVKNKKLNLPIETILI